MIFIAVISYCCLIVELIFCKIKCYLAHSTYIHIHTASKWAITLFPIQNLFDLLKHYLLSTLKEVE